MRCERAFEWGRGVKERRRAEAEKAARPGKPRGSVPGGLERPDAEQDAADREQGDDQADR